MSLKMHCRACRIQIVVVAGRVTEHESTLGDRCENSGTAPSPRTIHWNFVQSPEADTKSIETPVSPQASTHPKGKWIAQDARRRTIARRSAGPRPPRVKATPTLQSNQASMGRPEQQVVPHRGARQNSVSSAHPVRSQQKPAPKTSRPNPASKGRKREKPNHSSIDHIRELPIVRCPHCQKTVRASYGEKEEHNHRSGSRCPGSGQPAKQSDVIYEGCGLAKGLGKKRNSSNKRASKNKQAWGRSDRQKELWGNSVMTVGGGHPGSGKRR